MPLEGSFRMSETDAVADAVQTPDAPVAEAPVKESGGSLDELPEAFSWVRDEISKLRSEAAKYRTRAREFADDATYHAAKAAVERLAVVEDEKADLEKELSARQVEVARLTAAIRHGLTPEALEFLTGETEEEIEDRATRLAEFMSRPERRPDPSQGSTAGGGKPASAAESFAAALQQFIH